MFFQKIKKRFGLSKVTTLTLADESRLKVQSTDARAHKIDGPNFKPFSRVQVEDKLEETYLFFEKTFLVIN